MYFLIIDVQARPWKFRSDPGPSPTTLTESTEVNDNNENASQSPICPPHRLIGPYARSQAMNEPYLELSGSVVIDAVYTMPQPVDS